VLVKGNLFSESLFLKVPDSIVVRIGKKVHHIRGGFDIILNSYRLDILSVRIDKQKDLRYLQMGHKMGTISSNLLIGRDSTEHDFCELSTFERPICNTTSNTNQLHEPAKISRAIRRCTRQPPMAS